MAILYVAAEAAELKPFAEKLEGSRKLSWPVDYAWEGILDGRRILLAANGAGPTLASRAVETAIRAVTAADLSASRLEAVVSVGFCGALTPTLRENGIFVATEVFDAGTGDIFPCVAATEQAAGSASGRLLSQNRVAVTSTDKQALASTGALAVEMEASGVATRAIRAGLPFLCIKVVSDRFDESFPLDLNTMRTPEGRIARGKIGLYAVTRPWLVPELLRLKRRADGAAKVLGEFLVSCRITFGQNHAGAEVLVPE